jgi:hypothetical protein
MLVQSNTSDSPLSGTYPLNRFYLRNAHLFSSETSIRWYLRDRKSNGLLESGAVVELKSDVNSKRPRILIDESRFLEWMRTRGMLGVRVA